MNSVKDRIVIARKKLSLSQRAMATAVGCAPTSWVNYETGKSQPNFAILEAISKLGLNVHWLVSGDGVALISDNEGEEQSNNNFIGVPRVDAKLSAGGGAWNAKTIRILDKIPFTDNFLRKIGRSNPDGLKVLEAAGDSMEPTIGDGDLVLVDERKNQFTRDGVYALVHGDGALVKRLRRVAPGGMEIISDNSAVYSPQRITGDAWKDIHIIGKVIWMGRLLAQ